MIKSFNETKIQEIKFRIKIKTLQKIKQINLNNKILIQYKNNKLQIMLKMKNNQVT